MTPFQIFGKSDVKYKQLPKVGEDDEEVSSLLLNLVLNLDQKMNGEEEKEPDSSLYHEVQPPVWKSYLYQLQLRAPKPRRVQCLRQISNKPPHYGKEFHGLISREEADRLVSVQSGCYLVRESQNSPGSYALSMRFGNQTKNFRLYYDGMHYVAEKRFETLNDLVEDGLIAMYIESNARDYIDTMMLEAAANNPPAVPERTEASGRRVSASDEHDRKPTFSAIDSSSQLNVLTMINGYSSVGNLPRVHTYKGFYWCDFCKNFLWGLKQQGHKCQDCGYNAHKQCTVRLKEHNCQPDKKLIKRVFGVDLTTLVKAHGTKIPKIVEQCIEEVEKRGMIVEGIYRVSGFADDIESLKNLYDKGDVEDIGPSKYGDINIIAGALKLYFRMLPLPIVTFETYPKFIDAVKIDEDAKIEAIGRALGELPHAHYTTLKYLMGHLNRVAVYQPQNMMNPENLSIVFGPTLMRLPEEKNPMESLDLLKFQRLAVHCMIEEYRTLFEG